MRQIALLQLLLKLRKAFEFRINAILPSPLLASICTQPGPQCTYEPNHRL